MLTEAKKAAARTSLLLKNLPESAVEKLLAGAVTKTYGHGEILFLQGETSNVIHVVLEGWVKLYRVSPNGNEAVVSVFTRGQSFGEAVALRSEEYPVSGEAATDCTLLQIATSSLIGMMKEQPEICISVVASTFQHLHSLVNQVEQMKAQTGAQRVAEFLLELAHDDSGSCMVTLPYDKVLIAGHLGMKPPSLSRAFAKLRSVGVNISRNHASIDDLVRLRTYAAQDPAGAWSHAL
ncbi:MAG: Crp/Fnr family transcriptional regulator [Stappiaceae bacterium]